MILEILKSIKEFLFGPSFAIIHICGSLFQWDKFVDFEISGLKFVGIWISTEASTKRYNYWIFLIKS
jgi:hypothetical protein